MSADGCQDIAVFPMSKQHDLRILSGSVRDAILLHDSCLPEVEANSIPAILERSCMTAKPHVLSSKCQNCMIEISQ